MGVFITFEGPDGSGKSTQIALLVDHLRAAGYDVLVTREPGGTHIGDQVRAVLHDVANVEMMPEAEILLYSASRAQLVGQVIRPALAQGMVVLSDRYADSTIAYQGYGRGLDLTALQQITAFATGGLTPDLTIFLDVPVDVGLERKKRAMVLAGGEWNRLDQEPVELHQRVRRGYLELAASDPGRWIIVDARGSVEDVQREIREVVGRNLSQEPSED